MRRSDPIIEAKKSYQPKKEELMELVHEYSIELIKDAPSEDAKEQIYNKVYAEWQQRFSKDGVFTLHERKGCKACDNTGYSGRVGLHELLIGTDSVKRDILNSAPVSQLTQTRIKEGMRTLRQDGIEKVMQGLTDIHAIRAVCSK